MFTFRFNTGKYLIVFTSYVRYFQLEISKTHNQEIFYQSKNCFLIKFVLFLSKQTSKAQSIATTGNHNSPGGMSTYFYIQSRRFDGFISLANYRPISVFPQTVRPVVNCVWTAAHYSPPPLPNLAIPRRGGQM